MLTRLRGWIARLIALAVTLLTLGRVSVKWDGVDPVTNAAVPRGAITASVGGDQQEDPGEEAS